MKDAIDYPADIELLKESLKELNGSHDQPIFVVADLFALVGHLVEDLNKRIAAIETSSNQ